MKIQAWEKTEDRESPELHSSSPLVGQNNCTRMDVEKVKPVQNL
jgi:hypothetical protein